MHEYRPDRQKVTSDGDQAPNLTSIVSDAMYPTAQFKIGPAEKYTQNYTYNLI